MCERASRVRCAPRSRFAAAALCLLAGCVSTPPPILPERQPSAAEIAASGTTAAPMPEAAASSPPTETGAPSAGESGTEASPAAGTSPIRLFQTPQPPRTTVSTAVPAAAGTPPPADKTMESAIAIDQLPLPAFIDTVFATILKRNVSVDPAITQRKELVSLKSGKPLTAAQLYDAAKAVLKSYNIAVTEYNGLVRVTPMTGTTGYIPEIRRGRSLPDVPAALRPVFQIVDLQAVSPQSVVGWLRTVFGQRLLIQDDVGNQAVLVSGQSDDVAAAIDAIRVLDQPTMRGRSSARIAPLFWSADEMAKRLSEILAAQGYSVGTVAQAQAPIILLPIPPLNSVIVFTRSEAILNHVLRWAVELDQPASGRGSAGYFTYPVRNLDAAELAKTLQDVMNPPAGPGGAVAAGAVRSRVVVNPASNTLIIQGSPTEYQQWFGLLQELDRPPRSALVSATIAEVRLNTGEQLGFEWMLKEFQVGGFKVNMGTMGAFGTAAIGGLSAVITSAADGTARALLNTLASTSRVKILANPTVIARNGETASIQVGQEVPIVTSQQTTGSTVSGVPGGGTTLQPGVLQSIQYRPTGVILRVKPVIHAGGRIDLDIEQEVSSASSTSTGVSASPTISTRRISTKLSITDGSTVLLGGLMQETASNSDTGVPVLKDIPIAGNLFKSHNDTRDRTELVVLITPYVVADEFEARAITDAFRRQFSWEVTSPTQSLRPERPEGAAEPPRGAISGPMVAPRPYVLPPADASAPAPSGPASTQPGETPALSAHQPSDGRPPAPPLGTTPPAPPAGPMPTAPATPAPGAPAASAPGAPAPGGSVSDPGILKELQKTIKPN